jgi:hypothetical protein
LFIGQGASRTSLVQALRRGDATTAEFRGDRLDIIIDPKINAVIGLWCGCAAPISLVVQIKRSGPDRRCLKRRSGRSSHLISATP